MDNFTNIGKAVLIQALGIQKNYTTIVENTVEVVDYSNSMCSSCKYKQIINTFDKNQKYINQHLHIVIIVQIEFSQLKM